MKFEVVLCPLCGSDEDRSLFQISSRRMVRCRACGLIYRNPRPTARGLASTNVQDSMDFLWEERVGGRRSQQFRRFLDSFPDRPGRLLDIGCGSGFFLKMAQERGWDAVGVDLNSQAVAYAKTHHQVDAVCSDVRDVPFPEGSFDLVTLWNVLDHIPDPFDLLTEVRRVVKDHGYLFIRTPNVVWQLQGYKLANLLRRIGWGTIFDERPYTTFIFHLCNFSPRTLRMLLDRSGFVPLSIKNSPPIPGDPYLGLGPAGEQLLTLAKRAVYGVARAVDFLSGGRCLVGPSLEAWGRGRQIQDNLVRIQRETAEGKEPGQSVDVARRGGTP